MQQLVGIEEASTSEYRPIEYWISRATDPYVDAVSRKEYLKTLCERVNCELEGAQIATSILCHKVVSPDQDEALNSLQAVDQLVRNCGEKVHVRVGKFRFLNQLVKLVTPKYLGNQTSAEVKQFAIRLLYTWQKQILHVGKFKEVYQTLKDHKVITQDPEIEEDAIAVMPAKSTMRRADFETDETIARLQRLVKNDNVQEANLYIQSIIKQKEQMEEREKKKVDDIEKAYRLCDELQQLHLEKTAEAIGFAPVDNHQGRNEKFEKLLEQLYALRASVQQHVQEAAERNDENLGEMIQINERVNHWIKRSYEKPNADLRKGDRGSEEECADLLGSSPKREEPSLLPSPPKTEPAGKQTPQEFPKIPPPPSNSMQEHPDVPFIGFDRIMTPQLPRRVVKSSIVTNGSNDLNDLNNLIDKKLFDLSPPHTFKQTKPTLNQLTHTTPFESQPGNSKTLTNGTACESPVFALADLDPITVLDKMNVRILLFRTKNSTDTTSSAILCVSNSNTAPVDHVNLTVKSNTANVKLCKQSEFSLPGVTLLNGLQSEMRIVSISHPPDAKEIDIDVSICFFLQYERTITSSVTLPL